MDHMQESTKFQFAIIWWHHFMWQSEKAIRRCKQESPINNDSSETKRTESFCARFIGRRTMKPKLFSAFQYWR